MLQLLESRLDNILFRAGFGVTRKQSRQVVNHGHVLVNGRKVDIPSYLVKAGDVITIKSKSSEFLKTVMSAIDLSGVPSWIEDYIWKNSSKRRIRSRNQRTTSYRVLFKIS